MRLYSHHPVVGEVEEGKVGDEEEPEELGSCPLEAHHGVYDEGVIRGLDEDIGYLHDNLKQHKGLRYPKKPMTTLIFYLPLCLGMALLFYSILT